MSTMGLGEAARTARSIADAKAERRLRRGLRWHLWWPKRRLLRAYLDGAPWRYEAYRGGPSLVATVDGITLHFRFIWGEQGRFCGWITDEWHSQVNRLEDLVPR